MSSIHLGRYTCRLPYQIPKGFLITLFNISTLWTTQPPTIASYGRSWWTSSPLSLPLSIKPCSSLMKIGMWEEWGEDSWWRWSIIWSTLPKIRSPRNNKPLKDKAREGSKRRKVYSVDIEALENLTNEIDPQVHIKKVPMKDKFVAGNET